VTTQKLAAHLEGSGNYYRTKNMRSVRVTLPELMQAALDSADSPHDFRRPAVDPKRDRQRDSLAASFGEGLCPAKPVVTTAAEDGRGVKIGSGRTPKDPILMPGPPGGKARLGTSIFLIRFPMRSPTMPMLVGGRWGRGACGEGGKSSKQANEP